MAKTIQQIDADFTYQDTDSTVQDILDYLEENGGSSNAVVRQLFFTSALPQGFTYTRSDNNIATRRNSTGAMEVVAANTPRFNYTSTGIPLGLLFEPSRQNKCTAYNASPTGLTGLTVGGNVSASVTIQSDTANLTTDKINLGNGNVIEIDNTLGGSGTAWVAVAGQFGNTNAHSMFCYIKNITGTTGNISDSGGGNSVTQSGTGAYLYTAIENFTPSSTTHTLRLNAPIGTKVRFTLFQVEEGAFCTSPIIVAGAAATRQLDRVICSDLPAALGDAWAGTQGTMGVQFRSSRVATAIEYPFVLNRNATTDEIGLRIHSDGYVRPQVNVSNAVQAAVSVNRVLVNRSFPAAISWNETSNRFKTVVGAGRTRAETLNVLVPTDMTHLHIGSRSNNTGAFFGHIKKLVAADKELSMAEMGSLLLEPNAVGILELGQSLADNLRRSQNLLTNEGEVAFTTVLDSILTATAGNNWHIHGATGGSSILNAYDGGNGYWSDGVTATGIAWQTAKDAIDFFQGGGGIIRGAIWDGAQTDAGAIVLQGSAYDNVLAAHNIVFNRIRALIGDRPIMIMPTVGRTDGDSPNYQYLREMQWALDAAQTYIYRGPETFDLAKYDSIHLTEASYTISGQRRARKMLSILGETVTGGVDGPAITGAVRTGTSVVVTIAHESGTDFTPTTGILGFRYFDGSGNEIAISSAVRSTATTITLTLASGVAGTLYYGYGNVNVTLTSLVDDNTSQAMPLRGYKQAVT